MAKIIDKFGKVVVIVGTQWGDEGKGKLTDILSPHFDITARYGGGANAGHTVIASGQKYIFHLIPSGILHERTVGVLGNGMVIHLPTFIDELKTLKDLGIKIGGRLKISDRAHIVIDYHKIIDGLQEDRKAGEKIGTTRRGIGPSYTSKVGRTGIRICDLFDFKYFSHKFEVNAKTLMKRYQFKFDIRKKLNVYKKILKIIKPMVTNVSYFMNDAVNKEKRILIEGAQGTMLDVDHGSYPYVTSSNTVSGGACTGLGISPTAIDTVIGITKAYTTRVGGGPFPTELTGKLGDEIRDRGGEFGSTTGRPRRCGWFDAVVVNYAGMINGITSTNITKLDVLDSLKEIKICASYISKNKYLKGMPSKTSILDNVKIKYITMPGWQENTTGINDFKKLPKNAQNYIKKIEELTNAPINFIGIGQSRTQMIVKI